MFSINVYNKVNKWYTKHIFESIGMSVMTVIFEAIFTTKALNLQSCVKVHQLNIITHILKYTLSFVLSHLSFHCIYVNLIISKIMSTSNDSFICTLLLNYIIEVLIIIRPCSLGKGQFQYMSVDVIGCQRMTRKPRTQLQYQI